MPKSIAVWIASKFEDYIKVVFVVVADFNDFADLSVVVHRQPLLPLPTCLSLVESAWACSEDGLAATFLGGKAVAA